MTSRPHNHHHHYHHHHYHHTITNTDPPLYIVFSHNKQNYFLFQYNFSLYHFFTPWLKLKTWTLQGHLTVQLIIYNPYGHELYIYTTNFFLWCREVHGSNLLEHNVHNYNEMSHKMRFHWFDWNDGAFDSSMCIWSRLLIALVCTVANRCGSWSTVINDTVTNWCNFSTSSDHEWKAKTR